MALLVINTRADLDALAGTPEHDAFMARLAGSLWRLERDDVALTWKAVEDDTIIARFGFARTDFPLAVAPSLPVYVPPPSSVPHTVSRAQGKTALIQAGKWDAVTAYVAAIADPTQKALANVALNDTQDWRRDSPFLSQAAAAVGLTSANLDALFTAAAAIVL
ncbi:hypothetical protein [Castellaniella sp.]|uniref:hypothetical protein n=1 Tax=Castellaniella sp. TaxID=1955812 RepID=UPI0025BEFFE5|nr:hypothetical protein [Castellaniella sp.]